MGTAQGIRGEDWEVNFGIIKALNAGLDAVHHALERQAPVVKEGEEAPECSVCMGEKFLWDETRKLICPNCLGLGTTWKNN